LLWLCIYVSGIELKTLDAWSLGTYALSLVC
jgi:hypothetical protein